MKKEELLRNMIYSSINSERIKVVEKKLGEAGYGNDSERDTEGKTLRQKLLEMPDAILQEIVPGNLLGVATRLRDNERIKSKGEYFPEGFGQAAEESAFHSFMQRVVNRLDSEHANLMNIDQKVQRLEKEQKRAEQDQERFKKLQSQIDDLRDQQKRSTEVTTTIQEGVVQLAGDCERLAPEQRKGRWQKIKEAVAWGLSPMDPRSIKNKNDFWSFVGCWVGVFGGPAAGYSYALWRNSSETSSPAPTPTTAALTAAMTSVAASTLAKIAQTSG